MSSENETLELMRRRVDPEPDDKILDGYVLNRWGVIMNGDIEFSVHPKGENYPICKVKICCIGGWWYEATGVNLCQSGRSSPLTMHYGYDSKEAAMRAATDDILEYCQRGSDVTREQKQCAIIIQAIKDYWQGETGPEQLSLF